MFGAAAAEFVLWPKFGTSTYFLLTALSLVDFLSGLALRTRRRAVAAAPAPAPPPKAKAKAAAKVEAPAELRRPRTGSRTCTSACRVIGAAGSLCCRIRVEGSPRAETGAARRYARGGRAEDAFTGNPVAGSQVTGGPVTGDAAGPRLSATAG